MSSDNDHRTRRRGRTTFDRSGGNGQSPALSTSTSTPAIAGSFEDTWRRRAPYHSGAALLAPNEPKSAARVAKKATALSVGNNDPFFGANDLPGLTPPGPRVVRSGSMPPLNNEGTSHTDDRTVVSRIAGDGDNRRLAGVRRTSSGRQRKNGRQKRSFHHAASFASFSPYGGGGIGSGGSTTATATATITVTGGFSGRSRPETVGGTVALRRSAPPHTLSESRPASESIRHFSPSDGEVVGLSKYSARLLTQLSQYGRTFLYGSPHASDFSTLTSSTIASRVVILLCVITTVYIPSLYDAMNEAPKWDYRPGRKLAGRNCVMNLYIEKQAHDEFNPDHVEIKPKKDKRGKPIKLKKKEMVQPPPTIVNGTYRTKGQMKVVGRFIESVANSFRSNLTISQHLIFTNVRDGGHLAEKALKHWPLRGTYPTQLHVVAADEDEEEASEDGDEGDALRYSVLNKIEERFKGNSRVHVYDRVGLAGLPNDDDEAESLDLPENNFGRDGFDDDELVSSSMDKGDNSTSGRRRRVLKKKRIPYPDLREFFPPDEHNSFVPYMHVDGEFFDDQLEILEKARPLLQLNIVVAIGLEHSVDLDVFELIDFFNSVKYKTFFLGSRQIHRLDHICPEMLEDILSHPQVAHHPQLPPVEHFIQETKKWIVPVDDEKDPPKPRQLFPPFFVAMPRGRLNKEEMTIQHMYDLFGGYGGGGGQIKTANDRKMPGK